MNAAGRLGSWNFSWLRMAAVVSVAMGMLAAPALATPANFNPSWGFDAAGLGGLPQVSIGASTPFLSAGESGAFPNLDVAFTGSTQICVLAPGSATCRGANPPLSGPFSVLVSLTVDVLNPSVTGSFTLMLTSLVGGLGYTPGDVAIAVVPVVVILPVAVTAPVAVMPDEAPRTAAVSSARSNRDALTSSYSRSAVR